MNISIWSINICSRSVHKAVHCVKSPLTSALSEYKLHLRDNKIKYKISTILDNFIMSIIAEFNLLHYRVAEHMHL